MTRQNKEKVNSAAALSYQQGQEAGLRWAINELDAHARAELEGCDAARVLADLRLVLADQLRIVENGG